MSATLLSDTKIRTNEIRVSYEHLLKPYGYSGQEPKYSLSAIIPKSDKQTMKVIEQAIKNAEKKGTEKYGDKFTKASRRSPVHDGDVEKEEEAYENSFYLNCKNPKKPMVLDADGNTPEEEEIYSGMYGKLIISFFPYCKSAGACGVSVNLLAFKKTRDGEALGGDSARESDFDDEEEDSFLD